MEEIKNIITAVWLEKDHISCQVKYTGPKSFTVESISLEYQDKITKEKKWQNVCGPKTANDRFVSLTINMPQIPESDIINGKLTIGLVNQSNMRVDHIIDISEQ